jgi:hypothetical protein
MDTAKRAFVTPERYRELEALTMQLMLQLPHQNLGECMIIHDIGTNILRRWVENERMAEHEIAARKGTTLQAVSGGKIIHLKPTD